jgi:folate-binding Fe-S cluster repair protein YgfZ
MVNFETLGAVDFRKGCYPGQEIVARAQYRGQVKRRMVRLPVPEGAQPLPGQEINGGTVVDSAGGEMLAVMPL